MLLLLALGCRPDVGLPNYPDASALADTSESGWNGGPDPYEAGEDRLSMGLYYESGYSEAIPIDDLTTHYYIYNDTYTESVDMQDVVEGEESAVITHGSAGWFGGGLTWDSGVDLSGWTTMWVSFKSSDAGFTSLNIHLTGGTEAIVEAATYGFVPDGEWHHLEIPLSDFEAGGADLSVVTGPFVMIGEGGAEGEVLRVDNLYLTAD